MPKLNQIIAIEKEVKSRVYGLVTEMHKRSQKADLFNGFTKTYRKKNEEGEEYPPERKKVQVVTADLFRELQSALTELFDVTATKDYANMGACADVELENGTKLEKVPVQYLIFLEKQLTDIRTFVEKIPVLDESEDWVVDPNSNLYKTPVTATHRTKKIEKPIVLYDATDKHPAQTQMVSEDVVVGYWETVKMSSALPIPTKNVILSRIEKAIHAVKFSREQANNSDAPDQKIGEKLLDYLFAQ